MGMLSKVHAREKMIQQQIIARGLHDQSVLTALRTVERHRFVPTELRGEAYDDNPLPIGYGQTISQPYIVALMTSLLEIDAHSRVLEIGTGSGYQTAVLAEIAAEVYTIEIIPELASRAEALFAELGYTNIHVRCGDGHVGWPEHAPFDAIMVTAAPHEIPPALTEQMAVGGRLVIPVGNFYQDLLVLTREEKGIEKRNVTAVRFVPMTGGK